MMFPLFALLLTVALIRADEPALPSPSGQAIENFDWKTLPRSDSAALQFETESPTNAKDSPSLKVTYLGTEPFTSTLIEIPPATMGDRTTHSYHITGEVRFEQGWPGSYMQLWTHDGFWLYRDSWATGGPLLDFTGPGNWQPFDFAADPQFTEGNLLLTQLKLCLAGPCTLHFRNVKLMQYPLAPPPPKSEHEPQIVQQLSWTQGNFGFLSQDSGGSSMWSISYPKITATHFAVVGEIRYRNVSNLTLGLYAGFLPDNPGALPTSLVIRTGADSGPLGKIDGSSDWRPFWLPYDLSASKDRLTSLFLNLEDSGDGKHGTVYLRNVKLVQYPDGNFPLALAPTGKIPSAVPPTSPPFVVTEFHWGGEDLEPFDKWPWTGGLAIPGVLSGEGIGFEWHDKGPVSQTIRTLGSDITSQITSAHYAIKGKLKYSNVAAGSYLELLSYFAPEKEGGQEAWYFSRTLADAGPMAKLEGTDEGRDFLLPFDATGAKTKLIRLVLNVHLGGPGSVELTNVKLIQYPDSSAPATDPSLKTGTPLASDNQLAPKVNIPNPAPAQPPKIDQLVINVGVGADGRTKYSAGGVDYPNVAAIQQFLKDQHQSNPKLSVIISAEKAVPYNDLASVIDATKQAQFTSASIAVAPDRALTTGVSWKSFLLGIMATIAVIAAAGSFSFLSRRLKKRRHEKELRRIASLDS